MEAYNIPPWYKFMFFAIMDTQIYFGVLVEWIFDHRDKAESDFFPKRNTWNQQAKEPVKLTMDSFFVNISQKGPFR